MVLFQRPIRTLRTFYSLYVHEMGRSLFGRRADSVSVASNSIMLLLPHS